MTLKALALSLMLMTNPAWSQPPPAEVTSSLGNPSLQGASEVTLLGFELYDAALWTDGSGFSYDARFALSLTYARAFSARQLAERTRLELARIERVSPESLEDLDGIDACFADVSRGDRITAVNRGADRIRVFLNGTRTCDFAAPDISRRFFSIWLGDETRAPRSRDALLGRV